MQLGKGGVFFTSLFAEFSASFDQISVMLTFALIFMPACLVFFVMKLSRTKENPSKTKPFILTITALFMFSVIVGLYVQQKRTADILSHLSEKYGVSFQSSKGASLSPGQIDSSLTVCPSDATAIIFDAWCDRRRTNPFPFLPDFDTQLVFGDTFAEAICRKAADEYGLSRFQYTKSDQDALVTKIQTCRATIATQFDRYRIESKRALVIRSECVYAGQSVLLFFSSSDEVEIKKEIATIF